MELTNTTSAMSASLLARDVYCVCFPQRDGMDSLHGELAAARKKFFTGGKKTVKVGKAEIVKGFEGKLHGKLSRHGSYWRKTVGKATLEESFDLKNGYVVVRRDFRDIITSRVFFDKNHLWVKSEYYEPWDTAAARVIFKPRDSDHMIERFDWDGEAKRYRSTELHPLPYQEGTAEQSLLNARFGEPGLLVSTAEGDFCYCSKKEAQDRLRALEEIKEGTLVLMPAWEVREGSLAGGDSSEEPGLSFTSLEEYAKAEPGQESPLEAAALSGPPQSEDGEEFTPALEAEPTETVAPEAEPTETAALEENPSDAAASEVEMKEPAEPEAAAAPEPVLDETAVFEAEPEETTALETEVPQDKPVEELSEDKPEDASSPNSGAQAPAILAGAPLVNAPAQIPVRMGVVSGRGRSEQQNGMTAYDGEYLNGKREGFGSFYDKNGNLCYAGLWKEDRKNGLGVSFRDTDHALHIANWENGKPGGFVSLFDKDGNLRYGGRIENGRKEGAGVSFNQGDGTVFVGKWENGQPTGVGSSFDREGNLLYYGSWKDGKRNGHGTEFDGSGGIVFDGEWKDGKYHNGILYQRQPQEAKAEDEEPSWDL